MSETWARLHALFDATVDLDPEAQAVVLDAECEGQPALRRAVERLLAMDRDGGHFLDRPMAFADLDDAGAMPGVSPPGGGDVPETIGPYRVLQPLGEGGLGRVLLAVRDDGVFSRQVAIKLVRRELESPDLARRLEAERQILAGLDHPHIAELYDGGTTDGGQPYVVMEYVDGVPIDVYCDRRRLNVAERVALFLDICSAVEHAHRNLVIHRDIKPANILVDGRGTAKLLDFGIAKWLNPHVGRADQAPTAMWMQMMTPHYASPEQMRGEPLATTSDVYSLGVLLYRLVAGRLPKRFDDLSMVDVGRRIDEDDPPLSSQRLMAPEDDEEGLRVVAHQRSTEPRNLRRQLVGDLDAILAKALRVAPHRRYGSVEALAADLRRWRSGRPVRARRGSWRYRAGKLVQRHRPAVVASLVTLAVLASAGAVVLDRAAETARQRDVAAQALDRQRAVFDLLLGTLGAADPRASGGEARTVRDALEWSAPRLRRELQDQPAQLADVLHATGEIYANLGLWRRASRDLEHAARLRRRLGADASLDLASTLALLGSVEARLSDEPAARRASAEAMARFEVQPEADPLARVVALNRRVAVLCWFDDMERADELSRIAVVAAQALDPSSPSDLAEALTHRGTVTLRRGEHAEAADLYGRGVALLETLWGDSHPVLAGPLANRGSALRRAGDVDGAETIFHRVLALQVATLGERHPDLAPTLNNLAVVARDRGRPAEAEAFFARARAVLALQVGPDHPRLFYLDLQIVRARLAQGRVADVLRALDDLFGSWRGRLAVDHPYWERGRARREEAQAASRSESTASGRPT
ncbi:MAG: serine/threonine-protein kinase, partial [Acidobacteriota bacterium]